MQVPNSEIQLELRVHYVNVVAQVGSFPIAWALIVLFRGRDAWFPGCRKAPSGKGGKSWAAVSGALGGQIK